MTKIYPRELLTKIKPYLSSPQAIVITGIRRSGKTFLLHDLFNKTSSPNKIFLDLENPLIRKMFEEENYETIKTNLEKQGINFSQKSFIFLDEIQWIRSIPSVVKYFIDHHQTKFFLTGSASFYLKNLFSESLAGRKYIFELFPLSFSEFLVFKEEKKVLPRPNEQISSTLWKIIEPLWQEYVTFGAFPEVVLIKNPKEKGRLLDEIFTSYFQKEIEQLADFRKTKLVRNLIILLAENVGNILNIERFSSELGVSRITVEEWMAFLESTYLISLVPPYSKSSRVAIRKAKKIYFVDWALAGKITAISQGARLENCVFHLLRTRGKPSFYRKKSGVEIDFILNDMALEVKLKASRTDLLRVKRLSQELGLKKAVVISGQYSPLKGVSPGFIL
jgi:hypothetical protein